MRINTRLPNSCQDFIPLSKFFVKMSLKKKPPISRRFRMCSVTVLLAPPIIQRCSQEFLNSPSSLHRNHTQSNP